MKRRSFGILALSASMAAALPFAPVDSSWSTTSLKIPAGMHASILLRTGDTIEGLGGVKTLVRKNLDYIGFRGLGPSGGNDSAILGVNSELRDSSTAHGDGGGFTLLKVVRNPNDGTWSRVGSGKAVDFRSIGGTWVNCGGFDTPWGTMVSGEEYPPLSNAEAYATGKQIRDTSDVIVKTMGFDDTLRRYEALGWMTEIDPVSGTARKLYKMGRFSHEGGALLPDRRTVILTDDATPAVLFKFVASKADDFSDGQLYAYKQTEDKSGGSWIMLPMQLDSLVNIRDVAIRRGATVGIRHEWAVYHGGKVYINETGIDNDKGALANAVKNGGTVEGHLKGGMWANDTAKDYYGRTLVLDTLTNALTVLVEGGVSATGKHFSNPDGMHVQVVDGKAWLVIMEDLNGASQGRDPGGNNNCEAWWLDLTIQHPTLDSLQRMLVGANGAELTGGNQTPDGRTLFVTVQHPSASNTAPWDKDVVVALTGFSGATSGISPVAHAAGSARPFVLDRASLVFQIPTSGTLRRLDGSVRQRFTDARKVSVPASGSWVLETATGSWSFVKP